MVLADKLKPEGRKAVAGTPELVSFAADRHGWALQQASLLRAGRVDLLDVERVAEELDDVAHYLEDKLRSDLVRVLQHLLKWDHQGDRRSRSWMLTIREHRRRVQTHLHRGPGLRSSLAEILADAYASARNQALDETGLDETALPGVCPYGWDEIMDRPIVWPDRA